MANDMASGPVVHEGAARLRDPGSLGRSDGIRREYREDCQQDKARFHFLISTLAVYVARCAPQWPQLGVGTCTGLHEPTNFPSTHGLAEAMVGAAATAAVATRVTVKIILRNMFDSCEG
jgi:hypothetical protein